MQALSEKSNNLLKLYPIRYQSQFKGNIFLKFKILSVLYLIFIWLLKHHIFW